MFERFFKREQREQQHIKDVFTKIVDPKIVAELLETGGCNGPELSKFVEGRVEYVLVLADGASPTAICEILGQVADIAVERRAMPHCHLGPLLALTMGDGHPFVEKQGDRLELVEEIHLKLGHGVKVVHGAVNGHWGLVGSARRIMSYTFLIPRLDAVLGTFQQIEFGEAREFQH